MGSIEKLLDLLVLNHLGLNRFGESDPQVATSNVRTCKTYRFTLSVGLTALTGNNFLKTLKKHSVIFG
jgi:hypothetical protein